MKLKSHQKKLINYKKLLFPKRKSLIMKVLKFNLKVKRQRKSSKTQSLKFFKQKKP
jgi:hypothetical protein